MVYLNNLTLIAAGVLASLALLAPHVSKGLGPVKLGVGGVAALVALYGFFVLVTNLLKFGLPPVGFLQYLLFAVLKSVVCLGVGLVLLLSGLQKPPAAPVPGAPQPPVSPIAGVEGPIGLAAIAYAVVALVLFGLR